ncbi:MAG: HlyD family efflux transporter periplasmic adaptor subunit [Kangiellaceae bacterium]|nr:HlyD family efflux transporter periplasmic adaptor subunit [Kangiellaceae bacterium]
MDKPLDPKYLKQRRMSNLLKITAVASALALIFFTISGSFTRTLNSSEIRTSKVIQGSLKSTLPASGTVVPLVEETIASNLDTQIGQVLVSAGQSVQKGELLMQLDTTSIRLELDNVDEEIALKLNQIETQKLNLARNINELKGRLELLEVDIDSHKTRHARLTQLSESGSTSKHDLKESALSVKRTKIEIRQLKQSIEDQRASTLAEIEGLKLQKSILYKSRKEKQRILHSTQVLAPSDGLLVWIKKEEGAAVKNGESLARVADTSGYKIEVSISDFYANQLWQGMPAEFKYDEDIFSGTIDSIYTGDEQGILKLTMMLNETQDSSHSVLRQKQRVEVDLITGEIKDALLIEKGPYISGAGEQDIFVIENNTAIKTKVNIGSSNRHFYQVTQGLTLADEIIVSDTSAIAQLKQISIN